MSTAVYCCILSVFVAPFLLTVKTTGRAGEKQYLRMGVYKLTGETHNKKPVWSRHDGTQKMFYSNSKLIL